MDEEITPPTLGLTESELEASRAVREGAAWYRDTIRPTGSTAESGQIAHPPSATPISDEAFDLIVALEVTSQALYEQRYLGATWAGGDSGVTIGIGYDLGYVSTAQFLADWADAIPLPMLNNLNGVLGITGNMARAKAAALTGQVNVPFATAIGVHRSEVIPRWTGLTEDALPNTGALSPSSLGALVSLTYNRGAQYSSSGDRAAEMRAVHAHMAQRQFGLVPDDIRAMKRLWPDVPGLQRRRELEAQLFERGLPH